MASRMTIATCAPLEQVLCIAILVLSPDPTSTGPKTEPQMSGLTCAATDWAAETARPTATTTTHCSLARNIVLIGITCDPFLAPIICPANSSLFFTATSRSRPHARPPAPPRSAWQSARLIQLDRPLLDPEFSFWPSDQGLYTPTPLCARQISSSHVVPLPAEAALGVEPTRAPAFRPFLRHRSTLMALSSPEFSSQRSPAILPALAAPRSSAACRRTADGSDALPPAGASSTAHASPDGPPSSPAAAGDS